MVESSNVFLLSIPRLLFQSAALLASIVCSKFFTIHSFVYQFFGSVGLERKTRENSARSSHDATWIILCARHRPHLFRRSFALGSERRLPAREKSLNLHHPRMRCTEFRSLSTDCITYTSHIFSVLFHFIFIFLYIKDIGCIICV